MSLEVLRGCTVAQRLELVENRLRRSSERRVTLQSDPDPLADQESLIVQFALGVAENDRQHGRRGNRLKFLAGFQSGKEQRVNAGGLIRHGAHDAIVKA